MFRKSHSSDTITGRETTLPHQFEFPSDYFLSVIFLCFGNIKTYLQICQ